MATKYEGGSALRIEAAICSQELPREISPRNRGGPLGTLSKC